MAYWQFILQKEGERSWQPLETPALAIEAGRYRLVAHCDRANIEVEIRLSQQIIGYGRQQRYVQTYYRRTNADGLIVIMPFTELKLGKWEIRCCGDIFSELLGQGWQERIQLSVLSRLGTASWEWDYLSGAVATVADNSSPEPELEQVWQQAVDRLLPALDLTPARKTEAIELVAKEHFLPPQTEVYSAPVPAKCHHLLEASVVEITECISPPLDLPQPTRMLKNLQRCESSSGQVLPPKISRSAVNKKRIKLPQLPKLSN